MAYIPTTFVDRSVEFPNRRKLTPVSGQADTFDVARAEGTVFAAGTKLDAANLNAEFGKIKTETDDINSSLTWSDWTEIPYRYKYRVRGDGLVELYIMYQQSYITTAGIASTITDIVLPNGIIPTKGSVVASCYWSGSANKLYTGIIFMNQNASSVQMLTETSDQCYATFSYIKYYK